MDDGAKDTVASKARSFSAMNTIYHETQQEIARLNKQLTSKDGVIAHLKARLAKYERTCFNEEDVPLFVGPSKSLVDSLFQEIIKLQQRLKETEVDASQKVESSKRQTQDLQQKLREQEQELERVLQQPEHQKEREIQRLHASLAARDRAQATKDILCSSLVEEVELLRGQLRATVRVCQELLANLESSRASSPEEKSHGTEMTAFSDAARLKALNSKLQMENEQLRDRVAYVENLNSKWQRYDQSRELYVKGLCQKLRECSGPTAAHGPASKALLQEEIGRLNRLLEEKMLESERMNKEQKEQDSRALQDQEHIQMLEQQVLAYIEDFKSERADRERAQSKILDLQDEMKRLQLQIHTQNAREAHSTHRLNIGLKKPVRKQTDSAEPLLRSSPPLSSTKRVAGCCSTLDTTELQCPQCNAKYDGTRTAEFLNCCEECAKL